MNISFSHISRKGFTLVELLVSVALFSVIMMVAIGTLLSMVDANRKAQNLNSITSNLNFTLDSMTRTIRTGFDYYCSNADAFGAGTGGGGGAVQDCLTGGTRLALKDHLGNDIVYSYDFTDHSILRSINGGAAVSFTAPEIYVTSTLFIVTGSTPGDGVQPTVTLMIQSSAGDKTSTDTKFNVQTTVTQRILDL